MEAIWKEEGAQLVCTVAQGAEVMGCVVIDSTVSGRSCGGVRIAPDLDEAEVRALARAMTLKFGFLGLPQGGAKAGVRGDPEAPQQERWQRLAAFGRAIAPLLHTRVYQPATDIGTDIADIRSMLEAVGMHIKRRELRSQRSGYYTAMTVFTGAEQAARHVDLSLSDCRVAIEGFGKVGSALAGMLARVNARVVAISTSRGAIFNPDGLDVRRLNELVAAVGSRVVDFYTGAEHLDRAALPELPVELLCPCARHNSLHVGNAARVTARIICSGANHPVTSEAEQILFDRGVLCLPYFMTNCGGVLGSTMEFASVSRGQIEAFIKHHIGARFARLLEEAARQSIPPSEIAVPLALRRFDQVRGDATHPTPLNRVFAAGLELYRRGWLPGRLVASLSLPYFERSLA